MNMDIITISSLDTLESDDFKSLKQGDTYALFLSASKNYEFHITEDMKLNVVLNEGINASLMIYVAEGVKQAYINTVAEVNSSSKVFILSNSKARIEEAHIIKDNAKLQVAYGDLERGHNVHDAEYMLCGENASLDVKMAYINDEDDQKKLTINVEHQKRNTQSNVEVYGVMKQTAKFKADVTGHIVKGANGSEAHQASRVLNFDENVNANVSPILLIDENDVQASHACSMGTVDENHLYYLESRGLTPKDAVSLIVSGYLSVLSSIFEDEEIIEKVNHIILEKAGA